LHHIRDTIFAEDACQVRTGTGPRPIASLRNCTVGIPRARGDCNLAAALSRNPREATPVLPLLGITQPMNQTLRHFAEALVLRDRDTKFCRGFDDVFRGEGAEVLVTPVQAPNANAYAERWIRTVRAECLDWLLIVSRGHLEQVLRIY
jgi:hypothetical protein